MMETFTAKHRPHPDMAADAIMWCSECLLRPAGSSLRERLCFTDGLSLMYSNSQTRAAWTEIASIARTPALTIAMTLQGTAWVIDQDGRRTEFKAGESVIACYGQLQGQRHIPAQPQLCQLRLIANEAWLAAHDLAHLLTFTTQQANAATLGIGQHGRHLHELASQLLQLRRAGGSRLDCHAVALALLAEHLRPLSTPAQLADPFARELELVSQARQLMLEHYSQPLNIDWLCRQLGTNPCKLKQSFQRASSFSPHRMLIDIRMAKAKALLSSGRQVATVAYQVGFQHPSSFTAAFQRHFGCSPKSIAARTIKKRERLLAPV